MAKKPTPLGWSGNFFSAATQERKVISVRLKRPMLFLVALSAAALFNLGGVAFATNSHQDHKGACARSTTSISEGVGDLQYNGVLGTFANAVGVKGINGSYSYQMKKRLAIAHVKKVVTTANHGCDGSGGVFGAGSRTLYKGEAVAAKLPPWINKAELCAHASRECEEVTFRVHAVLPASCWNLNNEATIVLVGFVLKQHKKPKPHKPFHHEEKSCGCTPPPPPPPPKEAPKGPCSGLSGSEYMTCVCSNIVSTSSSVTCKCVGINVTCEEEKEKEKPPPNCHETGTCPPPPSITITSMTT